MGREASQSISFIVDNTPPTAQLITPQSNSVIRGNSTAKFSVLSSNLQSATLSIAGKTFNITGKDNFTWDTKQFKDGTYTLTLTAANKADLTSQSYLTVVVDNTKPNVTITNPESEDKINGTTTITFATTDPNLEQTTLNIDQFSLDVTGRTQYVWNTSSLGDGLHNITLTAIDQAGNNASATIKIYTYNILNLVKATQATEYAHGQYIGIAIGAAVGVVLTAIIAVLLAKRRISHT